MKRILKPRASDRMNQTRNRRALQLFEQALDLPSDQVAKFIEASCGDDVHLRDEVLSLLGTQDQANEFLSAPRQADASTGTSLVDDTNPIRSPSGHSRLESGLLLADRYSIVDSIGTGGMGEVYRAIDVRLDRHVAIKVLNTASERSDEMRERFDREMKSVAALSHPNVMTLHDIADHGEMSFAVMELVPGKTLRQLITEGMEWQQAITIAHGIAMGLSAAHSQEIMHRDIKPENVIVSDDGLVKVLDFGIARRETVSSNQELTVGELVPGTIPYMSPEQAEGHELSCATDIFSFGTVLFEMVTGVNPFRATSALQTLRNVADAKPPAISGFTKEVPDSVTGLIASMLQQKAARRPSAAEVVQQCAELEETSITSPSIAQIPTNVSQRPVVLMGRDREIAEISERLQDHPIVTIAGPGGVGKTSIAMEVARSVLSDFPGGVWMCELAPVREPGDVAEVLAGVLDGNAGSTSGTDEVIARLQGEPTLLLFDNCEHLIDAVAELVESLSLRLPNVTIMTTSRESLNVSGEYVSRLDGLEFDGGTSDAVKLFVSRATSLAGYEDDPTRRGLVQQIVARLDGLPLAIELAAPRLAVMSLEELLEALSDQLSTLRSRRRSQDRQATLERAIAWSFDLLTDDEQEMLLKLSVFVASFTSDAAMEVCSLKISGKMSLQRLVEQSVVVRSEKRGVSRYRLLEPIRQFCHAKIDDATLATARQRHAYFHAKRAEVIGQGVSGDHEIEAAEALNAEWADLREAVAWGREHQVVEIAIDPIVSLSYAIMFQLRTEAYQWISEAEPLFPDAFSKRADVNCVFATGCWVKGQPDRAEKYFKRADEIELTATSLFKQFFLLFSQKRFVESWEAFDQAKQIALESGDEAERRWTSLPLGVCAITMADPNDPRIEPKLTDSEKFLSTLEWPTGHAWQALANATIAISRLDMDSAFVHRQSAIRYATSCGNRWVEFISRLVVNDAVDPSVPPPARLASSITNLRSLIEAGEETHYPVATRYIVISLIACGQTEAGVRCSVTAEELVGVGDKNEFSPQYQSLIDEVKSALGDEEFERLRAEGREMTIPEILAIAEQTRNRV